jgi:hypothetical protein
MKKTLLLILVILLAADPLVASTPDGLWRTDNPPARLLTPREEYLTQENTRLSQENALLREWIGEKGMRTLLRRLDKKYQDVMPELRVYPTYRAPKD